MRTQPTLTSRNGGRAVRVGRGAMRAWAAYFVIHRRCCINPPDSGHLRAARDCLKRTFMTDRKCLGLSDICPSRETAAGGDTGLRAGVG